MATKRILFVVNSPVYFLSHRLPLAVAAKRQGYNVHVASMAGDTVDKITAAGLTHHKLPLTRSGRNPLNEMLALFAICKLFYRLKPDLIHLVTIKPVLYGGLVARLVGIPSVVIAVSGLGFVFTAKGFKAEVIRLVVKCLYRLVFGKRNLRVIFQNVNDRNLFLDSDALSAEKAVLIPGSGVDLAHYFPSREPDEPPIVIMAARLLRDKGVGEFVEAARMIRQQGIEARFLLAGDPDPGNPQSMTTNELQQIKEERNVEILGHRNDIPDLFATSSIVVLPSYYGEGLPKVLIEAAATGRAVVTTDAPGCRDAIEPGITGLLVPVRDDKALATAIQRLIEDAGLCQRMGRAGRRLAEKEFFIDKIVQAHLDVYRVLEASA